MVGREGARASGRATNWRATAVHPARRLQGLRGLRAALRRGDVGPDVHGGCEGPGGEAAVWQRQQRAPSKSRHRVTRGASVERPFEGSVLDREVDVGPNF